MEIDHKSGTAIAKAPGVCTVYANYGDFVTQIEVCFLCDSKPSSVQYFDHLDRCIFIKSSLSGIAAVA